MTEVNGILKVHEVTPLDITQRMVFWVPNPSFKKIGDGPGIEDTKVVDVPYRLKIVERTVEGKPFNVYNLEFFYKGIRHGFSSVASTVTDKETNSPGDIQKHIRYCRNTWIENFENLPGISEDVLSIFKMKLDRLFKFVYGIDNVLNSHNVYHEIELTGTVKPVQANSFSTKARELPGMEYVPGGCPSDDVKKKCANSSKWILFYVVQHLNDEHKWTREQISDWLDELHDSGKVNLEFSPWEDKEIENVNKD